LHFISEESSYGSGSGSGDGSDTRDDMEGSGDSGHFGYVPGTGMGGSSGGTKQSPNNDVEDNHHPLGPGREMERHRPRNNSSSGSPTTTRPQMSVTRAVTSYLLPIVVMWFGGIFSDWL
jgi:hypothetical protein